MSAVSESAGGESSTADTLKLIEETLGPLSKHPMVSRDRHAAHRAHIDVRCMAFDALSPPGATRRSSAPWHRSHPPSRASWSSVVQAALAKTR